MQGGTGTHRRSPRYRNKRKLGLGRRCTGPSRHGHPEPMPILVYLVPSLVANDPAWPSLQRLFQDSRYQLGLSIWNLLEIASASDLAQRKVRVAFLSSLKPVWLLDHVY